MIVGIGTDICDIRRIRASLERHGERFALKILCEREMAVWRDRSARWPERGVRYLATRFSAKEAFSKAIGMGMRMPMTWRLCEIDKLPAGHPNAGKPCIVLHGELKQWFEAQGWRSHISVTDESYMPPASAWSRPLHRGENCTMDSVSPIIIDVAGLQLNAADQARLFHPLVGGVVLFARNWQDRNQVRALCNAIKSVRHDLLIMVDHEGGRVQRFKTDGFTHLPPMRRLGQLWMDSVPGNPAASALRASSAATACGFVLGAELRACGVDLSFTPVLDLDYGASGVIGDRAFGADAAVVSLLAKALMHGLLLAGMSNCGKHFPGHGFVKADSHTAIPVDRRSLRQILASDALPYGWLGGALGSVMPAHVVYPRVDARPAGFSRRWLDDILRGQLGFRGAIFSDDLSMAGARLIDGQQVSYTQAAVAAMNAGCDMVLLCNQSAGDGAEVDTLLDGMQLALRRGDWVQRYASEERRLALLPAGTSPEWDALMLDARYMQALDLIP